MISRSYRCGGVVGTGFAWIVVGIAVMIVGAGLYLHGSGAVFGPGLFLGLVGLIVTAIGVGYATSQLTVTDTQLLSRWFYSTTKLELHDLIDVTVAEPHSALDGWPGAPDWEKYLRPGDYYGDQALAGLGGLLQWSVVPASSHDQVMHVLRRSGGPVKISPISCRLTNHPADVRAAVFAVKEAITHAQGGHVPPLSPGLRPN